jgi:hypothetical protein
MAWALDSSSRWTRTARKARCRQWPSRCAHKPLHLVEAVGGTAANSGPVRAQIPDGVGPGQQFQVQIPAAMPVAQAMPQGGAMMPMGMPPNPMNFNAMSPLEFMLGSSDWVAIKQEHELFEAIVGFETNNCYNVLGMNPYIAAQGRPGGQIGKAQEASDCCSRQCCGPRREFEMRIACEYSDFGMGEDMDCLRFNRPLKCQSPCCCNLQELTVSKMANARDGEERVLGTIYESCSVGGAEFRVEDANGNLVYGISGPCCPCDGPCCEIAFPIMQGEQEVGVLTKEKGSFMSQMFTDADSFNLQFPQGCTTEAKALLLGAVFLIDFMFFEQPAEGHGQSAMY